MSDKNVALDFTDIALDEIENRNFESAEGFIEDAADLISDDEELSEVHDELQNALDSLDEGESDEAFDSVRFAWVKLGDAV